jgi:hypothetical protein
MVHAPVEEYICALTAESRPFDVRCKHPRLGGGSAYLNVSTEYSSFTKGTSSHVRSFVSIPCDVQDHGLVVGLRGGQAQ